MPPPLRTTFMSTTLSYFPPIPFLRRNIPSTTTTIRRLLSLPPAKPPPPLFFTLRRPISSLSIAPVETIDPGGYLSCSLPEKKPLKVAVLLSGGVDSSVALRLLHAAGHSCTAFYLKIWFQEDFENFWSECPWEEDLRYAKAVCDQVDVPLEVVHLTDEYWNNVVHLFSLSLTYAASLGAFVDAISDMKFDFIASGHYGKVVHPERDNKDEPSTLELSKDMVKDQTYFLSHLSQSQLKGLIFPLGCIRKEEVRKLAKIFELPNQDRKDSQGICFLGKIKFSEFVARHIGEEEGVILEAETGDLLGKHRGFWFYTIGQRQGLRLPGGPWYVVEKDVNNNVVFVSRNYFSVDKRRRIFRVGSLRWFNGSTPRHITKLQCKVRHGPGFYNCDLSMEVDGNGHEIAVVKLSEDDQGLAAGQFAAFYKDSACIGSGVILESWDDQGFPVCTRALEIARMEDKSKLGKPVKIKVLEPSKKEEESDQIELSECKEMSSSLGICTSIHISKNSSLFISRLPKAFSSPAAFTLSDPLRRLLNRRRSSFRAPLSASNLTTNAGNDEVLLNDDDEEELLEEEWLSDEEEEEVERFDIQEFEREAKQVAKEYSVSLSRELIIEDGVTNQKGTRGKQKKLTNTSSNIPDYLLPRVAIVGRPNVGKSALFNRLVGGNRAIVVDEPGVTRDRLYGRSYWGDYEFMVVDTGGVLTLSKSQDDVMEELAISTTIGMEGIPLASREAAVARMPSMVERQAMVAVEEASVIIFLVDGQAGLTAADVEIGDWLRKNYSHKSIVLAVNKCESPRKGLLQATDFWSLGFSPLPISAISGSGTGELLDLVCSQLKKTEETENLEMEEYVPSIAIVGRPNVGKSSILNALVGEDRTIVSPVSGTTRDAIDTEFTSSDGQVMFLQKFRLIDTAGIRKRASIASSGSTTEALSVNRAFRAVRRSDVVALVIEAMACITEQDFKIAERIEKEGKGCLIVVNKWDTIPNKSQQTTTHYEDDVRQRLRILSWAPIVYSTAIQGQNVEKIIVAASMVEKERSRRLTTATLNQVVREAVAFKAPPRTRGGKRGRVYYCTQAATRPPTFVFFVNDSNLFPETYRRYMEKQLRSSAGFIGSPIRLLWRSRRKSERDDGKDISARSPDFIDEESVNGISPFLQVPYNCWTHANQKSQIQCFSVPNEHWWKYGDGGLL
ncbi:hypothetical protein BUALT_Bualt10G0041100 [Buddleja alternifolia]|uniref:GTPase Der n=1 Tax=Buddleja alternifolia TaxID=168488 RepID=A0AAV6WV56_9LAMI|nr:hypothetical protein BUALT_Bualt10G0041100 [Buddleja alternifolia]